MARSQKNLDAFFLGQHRHGTNDPERWSRLIAWIAQIDPLATIACEAAGGYAFPKVRPHADSMGYLAKIDRLHSAVNVASAAARPPA